MRMRNAHETDLTRISRTRAGFRRSLVLFHVLVLVSLLAVQFHAGIVPFSHMAALGNDETFYVHHALSVFHGSPFTSFWEGEIAPLYPVWLAALMHIDPAFHDFLECALEHERLPATQAEAICRPLGNIGYHAQAALGTIGIALVWIAGWIASGRLSVGHLSALIALVAGQYAAYTTSFMTEVLVIPLLAGVNVCLAWLLVGGGTSRRNAIVATGCGIMLGALILTRPPYEYLLPALLFVVGALILWNRRRHRAHTVALACILGFASLCVAPWLTHNYRINGFVGLTSGYGSVVLVERLGYNEMSWRQWTAAFLYWTRGMDSKLFTRLFGQETWRYFDGADQRMRIGEEIRAELADSGVPKEDQLAFLMARVRDNLPKHLAVSVPLAWRGMQPYNYGGEQAVRRPSIIPNPWFSIACWLLLIFGFVRGSSRNRGALAALAFCPVVMLTIHALVSLNHFRYNIGLVTPLSVGAALPIVWFIDSASNRLRRWFRRMTTHDPNRSTGFPRTAMTRAESGADAVHDALRADLGESSARASGYLSEYFFLRERDLILDVIGDETSTVLHTAGGARLVAVAPGEARTPCAPTERDASATARRVTSPSLALRCIGSEATAPSGPQTTSATGR